MRDFDILVSQLPSFVCVFDNMNTFLFVDLYHRSQCSQRSILYMTKEVFKFYDLLKTIYMWGWRKDNVASLCIVIMSIHSLRFNKVVLLFFSYKVLKGKQIFVIYWL